MKLSGFEALNKAKKLKRDKNLSLDQCKICKGRYKDLRYHIYQMHLMNLTEYRQWLKSNA